MKNFQAISRHQLINSFQMKLICLEIPNLYIFKGSLGGLEWNSHQNCLASCSNGKEGWNTGLLFSNNRFFKSITLFLTLSWFELDLFIHWAPGTLNPINLFILTSSLAWLPVRDKDNGGISSAKKCKRIIHSCLVLLYLLAFYLSLKSVFCAWKHLHLSSAWK